MSKNFVFLVGGSKILATFASLFIRTRILQEV